MRIKYLGTAAAEGLPAIFCNCDTCAKARTAKGKNIRTRNQILIDNDTLIDFPMDSYMHALNFDINLSEIKQVFITHAHMDHCYPQEFTMHGQPYAYNMTQTTLSIYANETVIGKFMKYNDTEFKPDVKKTLNLVTIRPYDVIALSDMKVTALPAKHTIHEDCMLYSIERGGKNILIMNDTGILDGEVYDRLASSGIVYDLVSFDCTYGYMRKGLGRHMGMLDNLDEAEKMRSKGLLRPDSKLVVTHFSHNGAMTHDELCAHGEKCGLIVAYDGLEIQL